MTLVLSPLLMVSVLLIGCLLHRLHVRSVQYFRTKIVLNLCIS